MSQIDQKVQEITEAIADKATFENGVITFDKDTYQSTLPEDISFDTIKKVDDHNRRFAAALTNHVGNVAIEAMEKDKDLKQVSGQVKGGAITFGAVTQREGTVRNPTSGEVTTTKGPTRTTIKHTASKGASGYLKTVKNALAEKAAEVL
jgi:hypothetical protein